MNIRIRYSKLRNDSSRNPSGLIRLLQISCAFRGLSPKTAPSDIITVQKVLQYSLSRLLQAILPLCLLGVPGFRAVAQDAGICGPIEVIRSLDNRGVLSVYTTFEGGAHVTLISPETDGWIPCAGIRFGGEWKTFTSPPGLFINNPSGNTVASWGGTTPIETVELAEPADEVFLSYSCHSPVQVDALDSTGAVVASAIGDLLSSQFNQWGSLTLSAPGACILSVRITRSLGQVAIDDFGYRRQTAIEVPIDVKPGNENEIDPINLKQKGALPLAVFSTPEFDATALDPATLQLGDPNLIQIATVVFGNSADLNGDGLPDAVLHFSGPELVDGGAITASTTELLLTGQTTTGQWIFGTDQVRIVGTGK